MPRSPEQFEKIRIEKKEKILDAALHVFAENGFHNSSISKVSKAAGVSKGLMYNYFESKEELLQTLISSLLDDEMDTIRQVLTKPNTEDTFVEFMNLNTKVLKAKPKEWGLYFSMANQPEVMKIIQAKFSDDHQRFGKFILDFFKGKGVEDPDMTYTHWMTVFTGMKISYIFNPESYPIDKMEELIIKQFIRS